MLLPHPDKEIAEYRSLSQPVRSESGTINCQTVAMGTRGGGKCGQARILVTLRMFLPVLGSSQPPPLSLISCPFCGLIILFPSWLPFSIPSCHLGPCVKMASSAPKDWTQASQRGCALTCLGAGGWGGDVQTSPRLRQSLLPWANPEVEEEARRQRWRSRQALAEPCRGACLGLGAGGGAERPGQPGLVGAGGAMASAELQGKYQKLAQEYSKVPIMGGD